MLKLADIEQPHNLEAERALLGSLMLDSDMMLEVPEELNRDSFYNTTHQYIFEAIASLFKDCEPIDTVSIMERLKVLGHEVELSYLANIPDTVPLSSNALYYASIVLDYANKREIMRKCVEAINTASIASTSAMDAVEIMRQGVAEANKSSERKEEPCRFDYSAAYNSIAGLVDKISAGEESGAIIRTHYRVLDSAIPFRRKAQIVVGARTGVGKTAFTINLADKFLKQGLHVVIFSLEMDIDEMMARLLATRTKIGTNRLLGIDEVRGFTDEDISRIMAEAPERVHDKLTIITPKERPDINYIRREIDRLILEGRPPDVIIVDHIGITKLPDRQRNDIELGALASDLKNLARATNTVMVTVAQLNREGESRDGTPPRLSNITGSDQIAHNANGILLLHTVEESASPNIDIIVVKNRGGRKGTIRYKYEGDTSTFNELGWKMGGY